MTLRIDYTNMMGDVINGGVGQGRMDRCQRRVPRRARWTRETSRRRRVGIPRAAD